MRLYILLFLNFYLLEHILAQDLVQVFQYLNKNMKGDGNGKEQKLQEDGWSNACKYHSEQGTYYNLENMVDDYMPLGRQQETVYSLYGEIGLQTLVFNFCKRPLVADRDASYLADPACTKGSQSVFNFCS